MIDLRDVTIPPNTPEATPRSDSYTAQAIENFRSHYTVKHETTDDKQREENERTAEQAELFAKDIADISRNPNFPHELFNPNAQVPEFQSENRDFGGAFLDGLFNSRQIGRDQEEATLKVFIDLRLAALHPKEGDKIVPAALTESWIIGFLIGRKIDMHTSEYLPPVLQKPEDQELLELNRVATELYPVFSLEQGTPHQPDHAAVITEIPRD